jgi:exodeoxyribonuclease III
MSLKIATFNTNSVRARLPITLDWIKREKPHILCLQETKVQDQDFPAGEFESSGFRAIFKGQKSYNGVAIITNLDVDKIRTDLYDKGDSDARFLSAVMGGIQVINVYVPQGYEVGSEKFAYKLKWLNDLFSHVKTSYKPSDPLIITGDFNVALEDIDVWDPEKFRGEVCFHPDEQKIIRNLLEWGFRDIFRKHEPGGQHYTFWDYRIPNALKRKMGWRIDYILATVPLEKKSKAVSIDKEARLLPKPSDHTFLTAEFDTEP